MTNCTIDPAQTPLEQPVPVEMNWPQTGLKLDLACGLNPKEGFLGVDLYGDKAALRVDLMQFPWTEIADGSAIEINCSHFIEHIPMREVAAHGFEAQDSLLAFFDECYRVLEVGGTLSLCWPALKTVRAFQDPTHRRFIPAETLQYLDKNWRQMCGLSHYNVQCDFEIVNMTHTMPLEMQSRHPEAMARMVRGEWDAIYDFVAVLKKRGP